MNINYPIQLSYIPLVAKHKDNTRIVLHYEEIRFSYIVWYGAVNLVYLTSSFDKWCFISNYCIIQVDE
jgi:hypothetical protein